jgi:hypothetical protein
MVRATTSTSPACNVSNKPAEPLPPRRRALRSGVLEVEDRDAEASQVVPLLDDRRHVVAGDDEPDQSRSLGSRFHQSRLR